MESKEKDTETAGLVDPCDECLANPDYYNLEKKSDHRGIPDDEWNTLVKRFLINAIIDHFHS